MSQYVLNGSFSTPDIASNTFSYIRTINTLYNNVNNWVFSGSGGTIVISDGSSTYYNASLYTNNQALGLQNTSINTSNIATQSIYFTKGTYNLKFRTLYRSTTNYYNNLHSLTVDISNGVNTVLSKILDGSKTEMNKINVVSIASDWIDTDYTKSLKTYDFTVITDGSYNLSFQTAFPISVAAAAASDSTIFLTNVYVKKYSYVLNGDFNTPDISYNSRDIFINNSWNTNYFNGTVDANLIDGMDATGTKGWTVTYLPAGKQDFLVKQSSSGLYTLSQNIYLEVSTYYLKLKCTKNTYTELIFLLPFTVTKTNSQ